jgi:threonine aldolase
MLAAMNEATFGDDSREGDATVMRLETIAAERTGKEAAAFMPSGTMTNLVAVLTHTPRGGEVLLESGSHILNSELGGITALAGAFYKSVPGRRGAMDVDALREMIRKPTRQNFGTALVCMETTHNRAGGAVLPLAHMEAVHSLAKQSGVPVHVDGARVFNAAVALNVAVSKIARHADSICFCVSKGLSAPIGSVLCGSREFIERARAYRRMVGGNLRQAGPVAVAGIVALNTMVDRLAEDHARARRLAEMLGKIDGRLTDAADIDTNIVRMDVGWSHRTAAEWSTALYSEGIMVSPADLRSLRFVTHRHIGDTELAAAASAVASVYRRIAADTAVARAPASK